MTKITYTWFQCALCPVESDTYYILTRDGKEIKVCESCLKSCLEQLKQPVVSHRKDEGQKSNMLTSKQEDKTKED